MCARDASTLREWSPAIGGAIDNPTEKLPSNGCEEGLANALAAAHAKYLEVVGGGDSLPAAVLMVVQPAERNVTDQRGIEACLWAEHQVPRARRPCPHTASCCSPLSCP
jgi:hypothetical protein